MTDSRVSPSEMGRLRDIDDREIERLFAGQTASEGPELGEVARFIDDVRKTFPEQTAAGIESAHIEAMLAAAGELGQPTTATRERTDGTMVTMKMKAILAAVAALVIALGGTAFAATQGALPDPVQHIVSGAAASVGIDVPDPDDAEADVPEADTDEDATEVDTEDADDQGEDEQADEADEADEADDAAATEDAQGDQDNGDEADSHAAGSED